LPLWRSSPASTQRILEALPSRFAVLRHFAPRQVESPMHMRSAVRHAGLLALVAVAVSACASAQVKQEQAAASAERDKITREATVDGSRRRADYVKCVTDQATSSAMDPDSDAIEAGDLADTSLAKCGALLRSTQEDFSFELLSDGQDVVSAAAVAARTTQALRASARGRAVAAIVDARRKRASPPGDGGGRLAQAPPSR
jgi:hypothetical protein